MEDFFPTDPSRARAEIVRAVAGLALMVVGAEALVSSASHLAARMGVSQEFIGLSVVAIGTSAPLIAIAIQAARRGDHDVAVGSVVGSNVFIALVGGSLLGFLAHGSPSPGALAPAVMVGLCATSWLFMARGGIVMRTEAGVLLTAYLVALPFFPR